MKKATSSEYFIILAIILVLGLGAWLNYGTVKIVEVRVEDKERVSSGHGENRK